MGTKWLETLKQVAPRVTRVALVFNPQTAPFADLFWRPIEAAAPSFAVMPTPLGPLTFAELEHMVDAFAREPNGGLIVLPDVSTLNYRDGVIGLAARYRLPAVFPERIFATSGGLLSYGSDVSDIFRRAAGYVDRILKGEKPADLPVQAPTKYELVINLKTAKAPDRVIWGTDWLHPNVKVMPNDGDIDLIPLYAPDQTVQKKLLVDNPTRLFGFTPG
jgi:putative ABC transport system substrate-binding protein